MTGIATREKLERSYRPILPVFFYFFSSPVWPFIDFLCYASQDPKKALSLKIVV